MHPGAGDLERRQHEVAEQLVLARDLELRERDAGATGRREHHVHRQPAAPLGDEVLLGRGHHLGRGPAGRVRIGEELEASPVDPHGVPHALELGVALHRPCEIELDVERHDLERLEGAVVAHRHHVVEAVDADPMPVPVLRVVGDRAAGVRIEALLDLRRAVLADVARLRGEDHERIALRRDDDVRVPVDDLEPGEMLTAPSNPEYSLPETTRPSSACSAIAARTFARRRSSSLETVWGAD